MCAAVAGRVTGAITPFGESVGDLLLVPVQRRGLAGWDIQRALRVVEPVEGFPLFLARRLWGPVHTPETHGRTLVGMTYDDDDQRASGREPSARVLRRIEAKIDRILAEMEIEMTDINSIEADEAALGTDLTALATDQAAAFTALEAAIAAAGLTPAQAAALEAPIAAARASVQALDAAAKAATPAPAPTPAP